MKKKILCAILSVILTFSVFSLGACKKKNNDKQNNDVNRENSSEVNSFLNLEHIDPTDDKLADEETSEIESESEKAETPAPQKSLKFSSYGNGTCAVSGIGDITDLCIVIPEKSPAGDIVTSIDDLAFYGNKNIRTVQIPSTVTRIGTRAFGNCIALVYISVDATNIAFRDIDGVLYCADLSTLLHYPAASGASSIEIPSEVRRISDMAFYNCDNLKTVYYNGSYEDWGKIEIGQLNYGLFTASISCSGSGK